MSLRSRREALGLTQQEVAERSGTTAPYYSQIESGRTKMPNADLRRSISATLGIRHVDFLVMVGELGDWEVPGFNPGDPTPDPEREALMALLSRVDLDVDNRERLLAGILQAFDAQDRERTSFVHHEYEPDQTG